MAAGERPTVAILGTGIMGTGMAHSALRAGLTVRVWNRTRERAEPLAADGADVADTVAEAVDGADVAVTILSDGDAVLDLAPALLDAAGDGTVWVEASTVGLEATARCAELAEERGVPFVDAPVLGTKQPAEQGELVVLASGPDDALDRCEPLFEAIGQRTERLGAAGAGTRLKLVLNTWIVSLVEGLGETMALAEALDIEPRQFLETIEGGPLDLPYAQMKGGMMADRSFEASFPLRLAAKDARLVAEAAERHGLDLPLPRAIAERMEQGSAAGHGDDDMAATYLTSSPRR